MLAKKTSKNQLTLPKKIVAELPDTEYFDITVRHGTIVLRPVTVTEHGTRLTIVRRKIRELGIRPNDIENAIRWARARPSRKK